MVKVKQTHWVWRGLKDLRQINEMVDPSLIEAMQSEYFKYWKEFSFWSKFIIILSRTKWNKWTFTNEQVLPDIAEKNKQQIELTMIWKIQHFNQKMGVLFGVGYLEVGLWLMHYCGREMLVLHSRYHGRRCTRRGTATYKNRNDEFTAGAKITTERVVTSHVHSKILCTVESTCIEVIIFYPAHLWMLASILWELILLCPIIWYWCFVELAFNYVFQIYFHCMTFWTPGHTYWI